MSLHSRNLAISAGIPPESIDSAIKYMVEKKSYSLDTAKEFLQLSNGEKTTQKL
jgi:hydroxymethylglutaryl-CoA reductase